MPPPGRRQIEVDWEKMGPYVNCDLIGQNKDAPEDSSKIAEAMKKLLLDRRGGQEHHAKVQADLNKSMVFTSAGTMGRALSALQFVADWKYGRQQLKEFVSDNSATEQAHMAALMGMKAQTYTLTSLKQSLDNASLEVLSMRAVYGMAGKVEAAQ
ncbi:hypothetical protein FACS1894186_8470 [Alphaproteobacteria bacterium]|nr:hypothetical protein FACS1894186_8470 [Alphaproteobacteria bacterium]